MPSYLVGYSALSVVDRTLSISRPYNIIRHDSKWYPLPVFEFRPGSRQGRTKVMGWDPSATPHPSPARQDARFFSRSMRCQNGTDVNPTSGFSTAIGPSQARPTLRSAVCRISITSRSTSIPTSSQPLSSYSASGISSSTLPADTPGSLAPISLLSPSSCWRPSRACRCRLRTTP